jgi:hypothetical protein
MRHTERFCATTVLSVLVGGGLGEPCSSMYRKNAAYAAGYRTFHTAASRKGLVDFKTRGKLMIPATKEALAEGVAATEAFDILRKWHKKQPAKKKPCGK